MDIITHNNFSSVQIKPNIFELFYKIKYSVLATILSIIWAISHKDLVDNSILIYECVNVNDTFNEELRVISDFSINCSNTSYKIKAYAI